jgi:hypothetical protein
MKYAEGGNTEPMTARTYFEIYEPELLELFMDPETALTEETARAREVATQAGFGTVLVGGVQAFPLWVWNLLS